MGSMLGSLRCIMIQVRNYFVAAGMNSSGIASAGGFGRALAEWIADGRISLSLSLSLFSLFLSLLPPIKLVFVHI